MGKYVENEMRNSKIRGSSENWTIQRQKGFTEKSQEYLSHLQGQEQNPEYTCHLQKGASMLE